MKLFFKGGDEYIMLKYNRQDKTASISTSKTGYEPKEIEWKQLFDKGKEDFQEKLTDKLKDNEFQIAVVAAFAQRGYALLKKGKEDGVS